MKSIKAAGERLARAAAKRAFQVRKYIYQRLRARGAPHEKRILFILGCQRSGTTLMQNIFDADFDATVYGEFSRITRTAKTPNLRLRPLEEVKAILERDPARLIVAKPICETQNALKLLAFFPGAKVLFLYRDYAAVASSNLKEFGQRNGVNNLRPIVAGDTGNWRAEGVPPVVRRLVTARFHDQMDPNDAAALFWYVRNRFFFDLQLDEHRAVLPLRYEELLRDPAGAMATIYRFVDAPFVRSGVELVRPEPAGRARIALSADIERLCSGLLGRLDYVSAKAWAARPATGDRPAPAVRYTSPALGMRSLK